MIRRLLRLPYRAWIWLDLRWIEDRIADELARQARHEQTMRMLVREAVRLRAKLLAGSPGRQVVALRPRDRFVERRP